MFRKKINKSKLWGGKFRIKAIEFGDGTKKFCVEALKEFGNGPMMPSSSPGDTQWIPEKAFFSESEATDYTHKLYEDFLKSQIVKETIIK